MLASKVLQNLYILTGVVGLVTHALGRYFDHPYMLAASTVMLCAALFVVCYKLKLHKFKMRKFIIISVVSGAYILLNVSQLTLPYVMFTFALAFGLLALTHLKNTSTKQKDL